MPVSKLALLGQHHEVGTKASEYDVPFAAISDMTVGMPTSVPALWSSVRMIKTLGGVEAGSSATLEEGEALTGPITVSVSPRAATILTAQPVRTREV